MKSYYFPLHSYDDTGSSGPSRVIHVFYDRRDSNNMEELQQKSIRPCFSTVRHPCVSNHVIIHQFYFYVTNNKSFFTILKVFCEKYNKYKICN